MVGLLSFIIVGIQSLSVGVVAALDHRFHLSSQGQVLHLYPVQQGLLVPRRQQGRSPAQPQVVGVICYGQIQSGLDAFPLDFRQRVTQSLPPLVILRRVGPPPDWPPPGTPLAGR